MLYRPGPHSLHKLFAARFEYFPAGHEAHTGTDLSMVSDADRDCGSGPAILLNSRFVRPAHGSGHEDWYLPAGHAQRGKPGHSSCEVVSGRITGCARSRSHTKATRKVVVIVRAHKK